MFKSPSEICFSIFGIDIYYYGVVMAIAVLTGVFFSNYVRKKCYPEISENDFFDVLFYSVISAFIGARLYYCLFSFSYYSNHLSEIFDFRQGGLSIHGGLLFGFLVGIAVAKFKKLPILKFLDLSVLGIILAQAIGRWGNFFNSEAFGRPTEIFCKLYIPISHRPLEYINYEYFHPTFLYESILDVIVFLILFFVIKKFAKNIVGVMFCAYLILYSFVRILVEHFRIDSILYLGKIPLPSVVSILIIVVASIFLFFIYRRYKKS